MEKPGVKDNLNFLLAAVLALSGCSNQKEPPVDYTKLEYRDSSGMSSMIGYSNLEQIEESSDLIVIGTFTGDSKSEFELGYDKKMGVNIMSDLTSY